ncbi:unnamed protein product [Nesidiocoris tenuis]|uniref:Uncharacterized protein n=1 Tax=Nesidiocoris tenuis TaxID=355587 RepID=A0A6H5GMN0_9HEMI|nr:unnamed protein product [Nesidiocoris tenuis]
MGRNRKPRMLQIVCIRLSSCWKPRNLGTLVINSKNWRYRDAEIRYTASEEPLSKIGWAKIRPDQLRSQWRSRPSLGPGASTRRAYFFIAKKLNSWNQVISGRTAQPTVSTEEPPSCPGRRACRAALGPPGGPLVKVEWNGRYTANRRHDAHGVNGSIVIALKSRTGTVCPSLPTLPPWRRAALPEPEPGGAEPGNPGNSINDITSRPDQHGGSSDQPPGTAQQAVGATIPRIYGPRACSSVCDQVPCLFSRECNSKHLINIMSCCGNILWFEKCNTSEYAAGGHRPTRSDAAKLIFVTYLLY